MLDRDELLDMRRQHDPVQRGRHRDSVWGMPARVHVQQDPERVRHVRKVSNGSSYIGPSNGAPTKTAFVTAATIQTPPPNSSDHPRRFIIIARVNFATTSPLSFFYPGSRGLRSTTWEGATNPLRKCRNGLNFIYASTSPK